MEHQTIDTMTNSTGNLDVAEKLTINQELDKYVRDVVSFCKNEHSALEGQTGQLFEFDERLVREAVSQAIKARHLDSFDKLAVDLIIGGDHANRNIDLVGQIAVRLMSIEFTNEEMFNSLYELILSQNIEISSDAASLNLQSVLVRRRNLWLSLLAELVRCHFLRNVVVENFKRHQGNAETMRTNQQNDENLLQRLINFPEKLIQVSVKLNEKLFSTKHYYKALALDLWFSLEQISNVVHSSFSSVPSSSDTVNLEFLATLLGKLCLLGYSDHVQSYFLEPLILGCYKEVSESRNRLSRLSSKLIAAVPYKYLESVLLSVIRSSKSFEEMAFILGDIVLENKNVSYLMTEKFVFLRILKPIANGKIEDERQIQNLIGYLKHSEKRKMAYNELFKKLLNVWSKQAAIINTSYEQHFYLTKLLCVCIAFVDDAEINYFAQDLMGLLLSGVEKHLHSPIEKTRALGMFIGEHLMNKINHFNLEVSKDTQPLRFEINDTDDIKALQKLLIRPQTISKSAKEIEECLSKLSITDEQTSSLVKSSAEIPVQKEEKILFKNENLDLKISQVARDSDDDDDGLTQYDLSNDVPLNTSKKPAFLRDCLENLVYSDNEPDKLELALKEVENLCEKYHFELEEICVDLVKVILHKSLVGSIQNFDELRVNAMVSVTVRYPKLCAIYLTSQFYEREYSFSQRTDILQVLVTSVQKLSDPNEEPLFDKRLVNASKNPDMLLPLENRPGKMIWKEQIEKRIQAKTKIKSKSSKTVKKEKENKFSDVYGYFFFSLINTYDVNRNHINIIDQDFMLLGKLIFSLSVVLYSAVNTLVFENMLNALLDFNWSLKSHSEPYVRKSILFSFTIILLVTPDVLFASVLQRKLGGIKLWLEGVVLNDPSTECQRFAIDCLAIIAQRFK